MTRTIKIIVTLLVKKVRLFVATSRRLKVVHKPKASILVRGNVIPKIMAHTVGIMTMAATHDEPMKAVK